MIQLETFCLIVTTLWANSADDKLMIFFPENRICHFMQIVSLSPMEMIAWIVKICFLRKKRKIFQYVICLKFYPEF